MPDKCKYSLLTGMEVSSSCLPVKPRLGGGYVLLPWSSRHQFEWDQVPVGIGASTGGADWEMAITRHISSTIFFFEALIRAVVCFILLCFVLFFFSIAIAFRCLKDWEAFFVFCFTESWRVRRSLSSHCHLWIDWWKRRRDWHLFSTRGGNLSFCVVTAEFSWKQIVYSRGLQTVDDNH